MLNQYYKFSALSDEVKELNKIKSKARLDCIAYTDKDKSNNKGLTNFVNSKGQLFLYKTPAREIANTDSKRLAEWMLTNNSLNFSSIYIEDVDCPELGYGYPNSKRLLSNGNQNPLFTFREDAYLFIVNSDYTEIEVFVIIGGRNLISSYYQIMIDGGFDERIKELRRQSIPYFKYEGLEQQC